MPILQSSISLPRLPRRSRAKAGAKSTGPCACRAGINEGCQSGRRLTAESSDVCAVSYQRD
jgi:hypothetical protein